MKLNWPVVDSEGEREAEWRESRGWEGGGERKGEGGEGGREAVFE